MYDLEIMCAAVANCVEQMRQILKGTLLLQHSMPIQYGVKYRPLDKYNKRSNGYRTHNIYVVFAPLCRSNCLGQEANVRHSFG